MKYDNLNIQGTVLVRGARIRPSTGMYGINFFILCLFKYIYYILCPNRIHRMYI